MTHNGPPCGPSYLAQIMGVASKQAGHIGVARAYRNLGLRVPWAGVGAARQVLRHRDSAITEHSRDLKGVKSFLMTGVPRGVAATEMAAACLQIKSTSTHASQERQARDLVAHDLSGRMGMR